MERPPELAAPSAAGGSNPPRKASGPGIGLAYDVAAEKLAEQHESVNRLNTRLGAVLAVLLATTAAVSAVSSIPIRIFATVLLVDALIEVVRASRVSNWNDAPDPHGFQRYAGDDPDYMKEVALPYVLRAFDFNQPRLIAKGRLLNWSVTFLALAIVLLSIARAVSG
jgi:hypothetical protein